ncbi:MAG TPA: hypothetical protein VMU20_05265 [Candidatus Dormibacteraeota bacterium]|nr:hypothetical protein [Candidatus Dormibacteraeota bacterium]
MSSTPSPLTAPALPAGGSVAARRPAARLATLLADPRRALLVAAALLAAVPCLDVLGDPDLWWHLRSGRWILDHLAISPTELYSYTAPGAIWTPHEWLSEVVFALLASAGGLLLVALVMAAVAWSGLWACALRARDGGAGTLAIAAALVVGARAAEPVLGTRPQVATFALTAWTLLIAERHLARGGRVRWLLPPLVALWANVHAGFLGGLAVLAVVVGVETVKLRLRLRGASTAARVRQLAIATGVAAVAAMLNPVGPRLYAYAVATSSTVKAKPIVEWMAPNLHDPGLWPFAFLAVSTAALVVLGRRIDLRDRVLAAAAVAASFVAVRNIALLVAIALPAWTAAVDLTAGAALARRRRATATARPRPVTPSTVLAGALIVLCGAFGLGAGVARAASDASAAGVAAVYPRCAVAALQRAPEGTHVFAAYGSGGYLIDELWPQVRVYEYGELVADSDAVFTRYLRIAAGATAAPSALSLLDSSRTDAVLFPAGALTGELDASGLWHRVLDDHGALLYSRGTPAWATSASASC